MVGLSGERFVPRPYSLQRGARIFVSSGSDLNAQRSLFEAMVAATNYQFQIGLEGTEIPVFNIAVDAWEKFPASRGPAHLNDQFVDLARRSHVTVVMIGRSIRPGTLEELEAVLLEDDIQVAVIWMRETGRRGSRSLRDTLERVRARGDVLYEVTGPPGSESSTIALLKIIQRVVADLLIPDEAAEEFHEDR